MLWPTGYAMVLHPEASRRTIHGPGGRPGRCDSPTAHASSGPTTSTDDRTSPFDEGESTTCHDPQLELRGRFRPSIHRSDEKASTEPSGDQLGAKSAAGVAVTWTRREPSGATVQ